MSEQSSEQGTVELTLEAVLSVYRQAFGTRNLLVNGFVQDVKKSTEDATFSIRKNGEVRYNPEFFKAKITNESRLRDVLIHELMHPILGDLSREWNDKMNVASDAIINAILYGSGMCECTLMMDLYDPKIAPECLLRPGSQPPKELAPLYNLLYPGYLSDRTAGNVQAHNVYDILGMIEAAMGNDFGSTDILFLGTHGDSGDDNEATLPTNVKSNIANVMAEEIKQRRKGAGYSDTLFDIVIPAMKSRKNLRTEYLSDFMLRKSMNRVTTYFQASRSGRTIIPKNMTRTQAMTLASGRPVLFYRDEGKSLEKSKNGIEFYVDFSGSVFLDLPEMLGVIRNLRADIKYVYGFSNKVCRTSIENLKRGILDTTGGTDFNCIIRHAVKNRINRFVIFTDGYAYIDKECQALAKANIEKICVILFGKHAAVPQWFKKNYGAVYRLEELTEGRNKYDRLDEVDR